MIPEGGFPMLCTVFKTMRGLFGLASRKDRYS